MLEEAADADRFNKSKQGHWLRRAVESGTAPDRAFFRLWSAAPVALLLPLRLSAQFHQQGIHQRGNQEINDPKLYKLYDLELRKKVGTVFRQYNLFPHKTVIQNVMMAPIHVSKHEKTEIEERA